jgi:hypothetical protein
LESRAAKTWAANSDVPLTVPPGESMFRTIAFTFGFSTACRKSRASSSIEVAPLILVKMFAYREIGPWTGITATPSVTLAVSVLSSGRPSWVSTTEGSWFTRSTIETTVSTATWVIAHGWLVT